MSLLLSTNPYPNRDEIDPDEDGMGYALRMATANGLTFSDLARTFASPGHCYVPATASGAVAFMFGCTPARLQQAFVMRRFRGEGFAAEFLTLDFLRPYQLRQNIPQICPACIEIFHRARASWAVSIVTSCPMHKLRLIDRCACGRRVSWRRPSINFCECGRGLTTFDQNSRPASWQELEASSQMEFLLGRPHFRLTGSDPLLTWLDHVTADTFARLVWAFGVIGDEQRKDYPPSSNRIYSTDEMALIVERSITRLLNLRAKRPSPGELRVSYAALGALQKDCASVADLPRIQTIIGYVVKKLPAGRRIRPRLTPSPQLRLFEDDA